MSESRRRREADNLYGKVPQDARTRGIVISTPTQIDGGYATFSSDLDEQELRFSLLFWDELCWPQPAIFSIEATPEIDFLVSSKVLTRPIYKDASGDMASVLTQMQMGTFSQLDKKEPGKWAFAQGDRSFSILGQGGDPPPGALVELYKAVPIPDRAVPLAEILEFKQRRRDELLLLRKHLDSLAAEISTNASPDDELSRRIADVDSACADLISVGKEWQFPMKLSSFKASINIEPNKTFNSALIGYSAAKFLGMPAASAVAGLAAVGSILNIKSDIGFQGLRRPKSPFRYAYQIEQDL